VAVMLNSKPSCRKGSDQKKAASSKGELGNAAVAGSEVQALRPLPVPPGWPALGSASNQAKSLNKRPRCCQARPVDGGPTNLVTARPSTQSFVAAPAALTTRLHPHTSALWASEVVHRKRQMELRGGGHGGKGAGEACRCAF